MMICRRLRDKPPNHSFSKAGGIFVDFREKCRSPPRHCGMEPPLCKNQSANQYRTSKTPRLIQSSGSRSLELNNG